MKKVVICVPSGSGKSTLIRCINNLEIPARGKIFVDGQEVQDDLTDIQKLRTNVGWYFSISIYVTHLLF